MTIYCVFSSEQTWSILYCVTCCCVYQDDIVPITDPDLVWCNTGNVFRVLNVRDFCNTREDFRVGKSLFPACRCFPDSVILISLRSLIMSPVLIFWVSNSKQCWERWGVSCIWGMRIVLINLRNWTDLLADFSYLCSYFWIPAMFLLIVFSFLRIYKTINLCI